MNRCLVSCLSALALPVALSLSACNARVVAPGEPAEADGQGGSDPEEGNGDPEERNGDPEEGDGDVCSAMRDEAPLDPASDGAVVKIVLTNERDVPVYYPVWDNAYWYGCSGASWRLDGKSIPGYAPPACEGLFVGEPGLPDCLSGYQRLDAGATVEFDWDRLAVETVPVIQECVNTVEGPFATCSRAHLVEDGPHELAVEIGLDLDENSWFPTSYLPVIVVPFTMPTATVSVVVKP
ncbi:hypothetical protein [Sorangium sp. So ce1099]|uniref:hypothetical protein n=1 Tax=Sorangium sp. So ce1099 TaxID=3133331 RepID=UPI003F5F56C3